MNYKIKNLVADGVTYRGQMSNVGFDAALGLWTATAIWRAKGKFEKGDVTGADLNALNTAAIQIIVPPA
jgi:hypothetical protein